jgi:hypothetical protein
MKNHLISFGFIVLLSSCNTKQAGSSMSGIYRIESSSRKNSKTDTLIATQNQFKLYTDDYYAYVNLNENTSSNFGIGFYKADGNDLTENNLFSTGVLDSPAAYRLKIERSEQGYRQVIDNITIDGLPTRLIEEYISIPAAGKSPLDGTWKLTSFCKISPADTLCESRIQYKIFHKGFFMFMQGIKSGSGAKDYKNNFGFGHFSFANNKLSETNLFSTFSTMVDQQVNVTIQFSGEDEFTQTIASDLEGVTVIERYVRLKHP